MKILHTSDWHLGRRLYGRKRYSEFAQFLDWLTVTIEQEAIDILLVAGDIFDTSTPGNRAQELYYQFLCRVAAANCQHIVIIAGNHDSPTFLNAPKALLSTMNVHIVALFSDDIADQVLLLKHPDDASAQLIVCAVPYLRDRDIRTVEAGESIDDKAIKLQQGIKAHYGKVCDIALQQQAVLDKKVPIVAMGHLFTTGGKTQEGDGVRALYVGTIAHIGVDIFPDAIDYLALGHLHIPQKINHDETRRYSGSPIAMGFGEARQEKSVCCIRFNDADVDADVSLIPVPVFQKLEQVSGSWQAISERLLELKTLEQSIWLEIFYEGEELISDLRERIDDAISHTLLEVLRIKNNRIINKVLSLADETETLDDLDSHEVFERCLAAHEISSEQKIELLQTYQQTINRINEEESQIE